MEAQEVHMEVSDLGDSSATHPSIGVFQPSMGKACQRNLATGQFLLRKP